ncbi:MAG TPA: NAD(P)-dependent oxidoreductase [Oligoflexia bacterium]|nr:NAD(P)-dependent oxidoreductase [Oligoflexia bacterium]HMP49574.1 NAD(P)-dependent oxidoreductase [Oligoflexia bacterium]
MSKVEQVVVVGGAGYIGCPLVGLLLKEGYRVIVFDNFCFGSEGLSRLSHPNLKIVEGSICDTLAVSAVIKGADAVILLAAMVGHRVKEVPPGTMRAINFLASTVVLDAAIEHGTPRFIYASTNSVYGAKSGVFYETTLPDPVTLYARLKLRMEERIISEKKKGQFHPTALRLGTCHGLSPRMRFDLSLNGIVRDALIKGKISLIGGEQMRAFIHVQDVAEAFLSCLKAHENLVSGEVFNVSAKDQNLSLNHLANMVKTLIPKTKVEVLPGEPDLTSYKLSSRKIEQALGFTTKISIEESIEEMKGEILEGRFDDTFSLKYNNT